MVKAGDAAPDFSLTSHDGTEVSLSALRGRKVLLWFYPEADTPG
jgi:peroxiredoxin Q/BCP